MIRTIGKTIIVIALSSGASLFGVKTGIVSDLCFAPGRNISIMASSCSNPKSTPISHILLAILVPTSVIAAWILMCEAGNELDDRENIAFLERQYSRTVPRWKVKHNTWHVAEGERKLARKGLL